MPLDEKTQPFQTPEAPSGAEYVPSEVGPETVLAPERPSPGPPQSTQQQQADETHDTGPPQDSTAPAQAFFDDKSQIRRDIERVLEEDLDELYLALSPKQRQQFRIEGERTAAKIEVLLKAVKVKLTEIIKIITGWLKLLPGINAFFLEQEAKIKAEKILFLRREEI